MKALLLSLVVSALGVVSFAMFKQTESQASTPPPAPVQLTSLELVQAPAITRDELAVKREVQQLLQHDMMKQYVFDAMTTWAPESTMPDKDTSHFDGIAEDIATVVLDNSEPAFWSDDTTKGKTAILVTTVGYWEGHFWRYVDVGLCNSKKWRESHAGKLTTGAHAHCDGGSAYSIFQIHADRGGIVLTSKEIETPQGPVEVGDGWTYHYDAPSEPFITGRDMIDDRQKAVRVAMHMLRKAVEANNNLCSYTGEPGPCPKGKERLDHALNWWKKHPFPPPQPIADSR